MHGDELTPEERKISTEAAKRLGIAACLVFRDGDWICDPIGYPRHGMGKTADEAIKDCAKENGLTLKD